MILTYTNKDLNYKQLHLDLTRKLLDATLYDYEQEALRQRIHYIETEYDYRPRYKQSDLRPRCKQSKKQHTPKHKRS